MLKNILLAIFLLVFSSYSLANPVPYIGTSIGLNTNTSSNAAYAVNRLGNVTHTYSAAANFRGVPFSAFVGLGGSFNCFYIAGEFAGTVGTAGISDNNGLKTSYGYAASIVPGVMLSDHTLAFARGGVARAHFSDADKTVTGGQFGLGLQTMLTQNIDIRGEYDFTAYKSFDNKYGKVQSPVADSFVGSMIYSID